jgi:glycosyltransferase involved in cell wall biosynthesis
LKIIIITQYFPPEVGAPQNRLYELAMRLKNKGADITVLTAMPNYPQMEVHAGYKRKFYKKEDLNGLLVHRCWIYCTKSKGIFKRLLNYFSFVITSFFIGWFKLKKADYVLCESPPLFLGLSAFFLKKLKRAKLIFNVSDLWPESAEKLGLVTNKFFLKQATRLEEFLYRKSFLITGQTQGIVRNISGRFPEKKVYWLKNGVDINLYNAEVIQSDWRNQQGFSKDDFIFMYGGILGHAQGLEIILHAAEKLSAHSNIKFIIMGSGPEKDKLLKIKNEKKLDAVYFYDTIPKNEFLNVVKSIDAAIIPLLKLDLFKGAIPSKIFEYCAMQKPLLLGVDGEAKELFIDEGKCGLYCEPENSDSLAEKILYLSLNKNVREELGNNGYEYVKANFNRDDIANDLWQLLSK